MTETPHDPREYVGDLTEAPTTQTAQSYAPAPTLDDQWMIPADPDGAHDLIASHDMAEQSDPLPVMPVMPDFDDAVQEVMAAQQLQSFLQDGVLGRLAPTPHQTVDRLDDVVTMIPGPDSDPDDVDRDLSDWSLNDWTTAFSSPLPRVEKYFQVDDVEGAEWGRSPLNGGAGQDMLAGSDGTDGTDGSLGVPSSSPSGDLTERQQEDLDAVTRREPRILSAMQTPDGREEVIFWLPALKIFTDEKLRHRSPNGFMFLAAVWNGFFQDGVGSALKGLGRLPQVMTAQKRRQLQDDLTASLGPEAALQVMRDLRRLETEDAETHYRIIKGLNKLTATEKAVDLLGEALVGGGEMLDRLAIDTGIPAEDRPMVLNLARGIGAALPYFGNPTSAFGRALFASMAVGHASEAAYSEMVRAGISPDHPDAPLLMKLGTAVGIVTNIIPFEHLTARLAGKMTGGKIASLKDLLGRMPPDKQVRFVSVIGAMARDGSLSSISGFLELSLTRLVNWHAGEGVPENYQGDVWDFVLEGQAEDAEMNAIMGAVTPQMMKVMGRTESTIRARKNLEVLWSGARRNFHRKPLPPEFFQFMSRVTRRPVHQLMRSVGQMPGLAIVRKKAWCVWSTAGR